MERLTKRLSSGAPAYNYPASCYFDDNSGPDRIAQSAFRQRCVERLAEHEETGLEPAMCANYKTFEDEAISKGVTFKRIVALMEADRDGRVVVLPCKVGDTVYILRRTFDGADVVGEAELWRDDIPQLGKTVFLTREAAEKALEAMKDE
nr:MAG TPA: hypothetical protein [Caudoviricetes sp.]